MPAISEKIQTNKKMSLETYRSLSATGKILRQTELIEGAVIYKMTLSPIHSKVVTKFANILTKILSNEFIVRQEKPIEIESSSPEPDISVHKGTYDNFGDSHPTTAEFVVEVAFSSLDDDLYKANIYAKANISEYWILDLQNKEMIVFQNPTNDKYDLKKNLTLNEKILLPTTEKLISLSEIL